VNELTSLGIILLLALAAGHIVKWLRVPEVTGYLLAGIALGPSAMGWISPDNLNSLEILSEVALGLILFSIGTVFEFDRFRRIARQRITIVLLEAGLTAVAVGAGLAFSGQSWQVAMILGAMSIETAAASTLMVIREYDAQGPVTELLTGVFAVDNLVCLIAFSIVAAGIQMSDRTSASTFELVFPVVWQLIGSAAVGYVIGFLLSIWSPKAMEHGERLILLAGCVLFGVGASKALDLSPMVTNLAVGATLVNLTDHSRKLFRSLSQTDPPLYAIFFVLAGAELDLSLLKSIGIAGAVYVAGRLCGKFAGVWIGGRVSGLDSSIGERLRWAVFAQAGLAVGLTIVVSRKLPQLAPAITAIALSAVIVFEIIGPLAVRWTLIRSGEVHPAGAEDAVEPIGPA
jgi:Kef-type K+ transport system membrane component KefB